MHERLLRSLRTTMYTLVGRAVLYAVNAAPGCQTLQVQVLADETQDDVEHVEPYGFTSNPLPGAEGVVLNVGGRRGSAVGFNFGNRSFRVAGLKSGEVCIYTDEGDKITLMRDRHMKIETLHLEIDAEEDTTINTKKYAVNASEGVAYNTPSYQLGSAGGGCAASMEADMTIKGNTNQDGSITSTGDQVAAGRSTAHHTHPGDSGGTTGEPNG
ncbi:phage baseplate assembly protein V [Desulfovibrio sp.]|uniref:phage baseplate assembly protein V n=1 Tax=Desulfovibrio sp. TaxID=885 RepID=UPI003D0E8299